jgi:hypothetical protein
MRGQAVQVDFMAGLFVFLLVLLYFIVMWDLFTSVYLSQVATRDSDVEAVVLANQLVSFSGTPDNWTVAPYNASSIGLVSTSGILDSGRMSALSSLPYANAKEILGVDGDFWARVETMGGARIWWVGEEGNSTQASEATRVAILNGSTVYVRVRTYE